MQQYTEIIERRNRLGITQKEMGEYLGMSQQAYAMYEKGKRRFTIETILKISEKLETSPDELGFPFEPIKITRCKDCARNGRHDCLLAIIENRTLSFIEHKDTFFCGMAVPNDDYKQTTGDVLRNMTDKQLAKYISDHEVEAYECGQRGGTLRVAENLKFWEGYLAHPDDEDY